MDQVKIGKFIAECRKKENLTQMQLAEKLGITDRAISKWENGNSTPDLEKIVKLAEIFNVSLDELIKNEEKETTVATMPEETPIIQTNNREKKIERIGNWLQIIVSMLELDRL